MIKNRFHDEPSSDAEQLFREKIAKIPVWDDYSPEEQQRLKEIFLQNLLKNEKKLP